MRFLKLLTGFAICSSVALSSFALAQEPIKIGLVVPMSGSNAFLGKQVQNAVKTYMQVHGDTVAGRKVQVIFRDNVGPNPEAARRLAQELVTRDKVDVLGGFLLTPDAFAAASIATAAKTPMFALLSGTSSVTAKSPYIIRTSYTVPQMALPLGRWAGGQRDIKKVFILVADYGPGLDGSLWFRRGFEEKGGQIIEEVRVPMATLDFAPYIQRIKDASPDAVFVFLQAGEPTVTFMKEFANRGLDKDGIKIIATEGWAEDETLALVGDPVEGVISTGFYTTDDKNPTNVKFLAEYAKVDGSRAPNYAAVTTYDAMHIIYEIIKKTDGKFAPEQIIALAKGMEIESPRGKLKIDPETRDAVMDVYFRKVVRDNGKLVNRNFDKIPDVRDPAK